VLVREPSPREVVRVAHVENLSIRRNAHERAKDIPFGRPVPSAPFEQEGSAEDEVQDEAAARFPGHGAHLNVALSLECFLEALDPIG
jgi:hypothetical protein